MTQDEMILSALKAGNKLTPEDALRRFGCMRLAARINDLRGQGHRIEAEMVDVPTREGTAKVARYWMPAEQAELFEIPRPKLVWEDG